MNQVATQKQVNAFRATMKRMEPQIAAALPQHISPERFVRIVMTALQANPDLMRCTEKSILLSVMNAAAYGLEPGSGPQAQGYLVPFKGQCQFIPSYRGMMTLAIRSGHVQDIYARIVRSRDKFRLVEGSAPALTHEPAYGDDQGAITHAYAIARLASGAITWEVMTIDDINKIRDEAPSANARSSPWITHYHEQVRKTVIRRLCKRLPIRIELPDESSMPQTTPAWVPSTVETPRDDGLTMVADETCHDVDPETEYQEPETDPRAKGHSADVENALAGIRGARRRETILKRAKEASEKFRGDVETQQIIQETVNERLAELEERGR